MATVRHRHHHHVTPTIAFNNGRRVTSTACHRAHRINTPVNSTIQHNNQQLGNVNGRRAVTRNHHRGNRKVMRYRSGGLAAGCKGRLVTVVTGNRQLIIEYNVTW